MIGGRKANKTLKSWVAFVKKVQKEENISYKEAMSRAKARKKEWQHGGDGETIGVTPSEPIMGDETDTMSGGKRRRRTNKRRVSRRHRHTARRSRRHH